MTSIHSLPSGRNLYLIQCSWPHDDSTCGPHLMSTPPDQNQGETNIKGNWNSAVVTFSKYEWAQWSLKSTNSPCHFISRREESASYPWRLLRRDFLNIPCFSARSKAAFHVPRVFFVFPLTFSGSSVCHFDQCGEIQIKRWGSWLNVTFHNWVTSLIRDNYKLASFQYKVWTILPLSDIYPKYTSGNGVFPNKYGFSVYAWTKARSKKPILKRLHTDSYKKFNWR